MSDIAKLVQEQIAKELLKLDADLQELKLVKIKTASKLFDVEARTMRSSDIPMVEIKGKIYYRLADLKEFQDKNRRAQ